MKRFLAAISFLSVLVTACRNEMNDFAGGRWNVEVEVSSPEVDKTFLGSWEGHSHTVLWGRDESMSLAVLSADGKTFLGLGDSEPTSEYEGKPEAVFSFKLTLKQAPSYLYTGIYPASAADWSGADAHNVSVTLPALQHGSDGSYDPESCIMALKPESFPAPQSKWKASFRRAAAINTLTLSNLPEGIVSVRVEAPGKHLSGERCIDITSGESCELPSDQTPVTVALPSASRGGTVDLWFCSWGAVIAKGETLTITASTLSKSYTRSITASEKGIIFREGTLNTLSVNMKDAVPGDAQPVFDKFEGTRIMPGVRHAIVVPGVFDPSADDVKLTVSGGGPENVGTEFKKISPDRIEIYTHISRIGQTVMYQLSRGGKLYELSSWLDVSQPSVEDGYVADAQCRRMLKAERKAYGAGDLGGLGVADMFDVCDMLDVEAAAAFKCEQALQISGWGFESIEALNLFDGMGKLAWDQPYLVMWGNGNLKEADFSTFGGYYDVNLSSCGNLTKVVAGPNMGGFWNLANCPKLQVVDISRSNRITDLQMQDKVSALKLVDLRYQPGGYSMASAGNINLRGLSSNDDPTGLLIKINREYFVRHNDSRGWKEGVYAAWKKGATVQVYEFGDNDKLLGEVPPYALRSDALSPENGIQLDDGGWVSVNGWSPDEYETDYWNKDYSGKVGFQPGTLPAGEAGIILAGKPVYLFGTNCYNLFTQIFRSADPSLPLLETTVGCIADAQVPVVRFSVMPFAPGDMAFYFNDRNGFLRQLDFLASLCDKSHILLIPSIFWRVDTLPLYFNEPRVAWGDAESSTHKTMISFATDVVNTLKDHRCIAAWEFGNEFNLIADLGFTGREQVPATCIQTAYKDFADLAVSLDNSGRMIFSGNSVMRNAQWHLFHEQNWTVDSYNQYVEMTSVMTPGPMNGVSEHVYSDERKFSDLGTCTLREQLKYAKQCAASLGKAYYVGEFTGPLSGDTDAVIGHFDALFDQRVQLSLIWCFSLKGDIEYSFAADTPEAGFAFGKIREYNKKFNELTR